MKSSRLRHTPEKIFRPLGFSFAAASAGIKASGRPDLALAEITDGATAAALFTTNRVVAAPVEVGRASLAALVSAAERVRAVVVNSGNANCATGRPGMRDCQSVCREAARLLDARPAEIFPSSTGTIGVRLPAEKILAKLPELIAARSASERSVCAFSRAIMTTDTRPKIASARFWITPGKRAEGVAKIVGKSVTRPVTILGIAKGAGMIHPQLATMLVYLFTDVKAGAGELRRMLREACDTSLNCISIDGDTSTNDTVLLLASGASGVGIRDAEVRKKFVSSLTAVCSSLAEQIVSDGEGVRHVIRLQVAQARSRDEALVVARTIAHSLLTKTAWAGADPNWGRILAAVGRSGVEIDAARLQIFIGGQKVCRGGVALEFDERRAHLDLTRAVCDVRVELGRGRAGVQFLTTDLTAEYVRINADYST
jgi:glutamate N-acetyltransferase/amino-acid N-acetyltransferase